MNSEHQHVCYMTETCYPSSSHIFGPASAPSQKAGARALSETCLDASSVYTETAKREEGLDLFFCLCQRKISCNTCVQSDHFHSFNSVFIQISSVPLYSLHVYKVKFLKRRASACECFFSVCFGRKKALVHNVLL